MQHQATSLTPCGHSFCKGCCARLLKEATFICPLCRGKVEGASPNHSLGGVIDLFLTMNPERAQGAKDLAGLAHDAKKLEGLLATLPKPDPKPSARAAANETTTEVVAVATESGLDTAGASREGRDAARRRIDDRDEELMAAMDDSQTPLHLSCRNGHVGVARALVEAGTVTRSVPPGGPLMS